MVIPISTLIAAIKSGQKSTQYTDQKQNEMEELILYRKYLIKDEAGNIHKVSVEEITDKTYKFKFIDTSVLKYVLKSDFTLNASMKRKYQVIEDLGI